jgi:HPt (histidine-containing phosphotransfer) domain-containing protein
VLGVFGDSAWEQYRTLQDSVETNDTETLGRVAHGLKGAAANIAAESLAAAAREIEMLARSESSEALSLTEIEPMLERLERELTICGDFIREVLSADVEDPSPAGEPAKE